jgi:predicted RNA-binding protein with PIN domain
MAYLIDGNNLLGFSFPGQFKDPQSKRRLIWRLRVFQRIKRAKVILVFDGPPPDGFPGENPAKKKFEIVHPPQGESADTAIKEIISRQRDLTKFKVISSDREIKAFARTRGARSISCKDFLSELKQALKENKEASEMEKNTDFPSSLEVKLWTEVFREKNG